MFLIPSRGAGLNRLSGIGGPGWFESSPPTALTAALMGMGKSGSWNNKRLKLISVPHFTILNFPLELKKPTSISSGASISQSTASSRAALVPSQLDSSMGAPSSPWPPGLLPSGAEGELGSSDLRLGLESEAASVLSSRPALRPW